MRRAGGEVVAADDAVGPHVIQERAYEIEVADVAEADSGREGGGVFEQGKVVAGDAADHGVGGAAARDKGDAAGALFP